MKILSLDTSSKYLSLAVAEDNKILQKTHRLLDRRRSLQLVPLIEEVLKKAKLPLARLDGFSVSKGPGSFTGLRIGITTIKGLAYVLKKPVVAIPSLDILVQNITRIRTKKNTRLPTQICPIVDAKQNKVYACLYQAKNGKTRRKSGYLLLPLKELLEKLTQPFLLTKRHCVAERAGLKGKIIFLGDGIKPYHEQICKNRKIKPIFAEEKFWYPKAEEAVPLALERFSKGKLNDVNSLVPLYLYPKECQIRCHQGRRGRR